MAAILFLLFVVVVLCVVAVLASLSALSVVSVHLMLGGVTLDYLPLASSSANEIAAFR